MALIFCSECGKKISDKADKCPSCGCPNRTLAKSINGLYKGEKSIAVYLVLCWFLGVFGAHRYYSGKTGSAIAMTILTVLIVGIPVTIVWTFVDLIVCLCNLGTPGKVFDK